jgi:tetratricopeptide (TPR) repeat protein
MVGAACLVLLARPAAAESYRDLVTAYVGGDREAVDRVAALPRSQLRTEIKWLREMRSCARCGERELADRFPFLGAVLLHTERAFRYVDAEDEEPSRFHLDLALQLLAIAPPAVRVHEPAWYAAVGLEYLQRLQTDAAKRYFLDGASRFPAEATLHLGHGAAWETELRMTPPPDVVHSSSPRFVREPVEHAAERMRSLAVAEAAYAKAVAARPDEPEAHLRRGRVLLDLGRAEEAERDLAWVVENVRPGGERALALLFRGLLRERAGRWAEAAALYRESMSNGPPGARTAAVALAHALDRGGKVAEARAVLDELALHPGRDDPFNQYPLGPAGTLDRVWRALRAAAVAP